MSVTLNYTTSILNMKLGTRNLKPKTRIPKSETQNPKSETRNPAQAALGVAHFMKVDPQELNATLSRGMDAILAEFEGDVVWSRNARGDFEGMALSP